MNATPHRSATWAGNKCDVCGKFRPPATLIEHESKSLDEYGHLNERWWLECYVCRKAAT